MEFLCSFLRRHFAGNHQRRREMSAVFSGYFFGSNIWVMTFWRQSFYFYLIYSKQQYQAMFTLYRISDTKSHLVKHEQQRHRTRTSRPHTSNIVLQRLAKKVWSTKSQSSLLNIYFRLSIPVLTAIYSLPLHSEYLFTLNQSVALVWHRTYPICDAPLSRSARRSFALLQKSRRNHRPDV